jgi:hypothetical protein
MLSWIHPKQTTEGKNIQNTFEVTRIPSDLEFYDFIKTHMSQNRIFRLTGDFVGAAQIIKLANQASSLFLPRQYLTYCTEKKDGKCLIEISWIEKPREKEKYL